MIFNRNIFFLGILFLLSACSEIDFSGFPGYKTLFEPDKKITGERRRPVENIVTPNSQPLMPKYSVYGNQQQMQQKPPVNDYGETMSFGQVIQPQGTVVNDPQRVPDFRSPYNPLNPIGTEQNSLYKGRFMSQKGVGFPLPRGSNVEMIENQINTEMENYRNPNPTPQQIQMLQQQNQQNFGSGRRPPPLNDQAKSQLLSQYSSGLPPQEMNKPFPNLGSVPQSPNPGQVMQNMQQDMQNMIAERNQNANFAEKMREPINIEKQQDYSQMTPPPAPIIQQQMQQPQIMPPQIQEQAPPQPIMQQPQIMPPQIPGQIQQQQIQQQVITPQITQPQQQLAPLPQQQLQQDPYTYNLQQQIQPRQQDTVMIPKTPVREYRQAEVIPYQQITPPPQNETVDIDSSRIDEISKAIEQPQNQPENIPPAPRQPAVTPEKKTYPAPLISNMPRSMQPSYPRLGSQKPIIQPQEVAKPDTWKNNKIDDINEQTYQKVPTPPVVTNNNDYRQYPFEGIKPSRSFNSDTVEITPAEKTISESKTTQQSPPLSAPAKIITPDIPEAVESSSNPTKEETAEKYRGLNFGGFDGINQSNRAFGDPTATNIPNKLNKNAEPAQNLKSSSSSRYDDVRTKTDSGNEPANIIPYQ